MITFPVKPREEFARAKSQNSRHRPAAEVKPQRALNLGMVLDLGDTVYFPFRGRAYGVPPLPWHEGERLLSCWLALKEQPELLEKHNLPEYYRLFDQLARLVWRNVFPVGKLPLVGRLRKVFHRWHLVPNPFRRATEKELADLAGFLLQRRTSTSASGGSLTRTGKKLAPRLRAI